MPDDAFRKEDNKVVEHTKGSDASHSNDEFPSLQDSDLDRRSPDRERHRGRGCCKMHAHLYIRMYVIT